MSKSVFLLFFLLISVWLPVCAAQSPPISRVAHMQQRREQRRLARLARRRLLSSSWSFGSSESFASFSSFSSTPATLPTLPTILTVPTQSIPSSTDPLPATDVRADIPLLGTITPILGSVRIFPEHEPVDIRTIFVDFVEEPLSVDSLLVYDGDRRSFGRAMLDTSVPGGKRFTLKLLGNIFVIPKREERSVYVRAVLQKRDAGGKSGETFQVKQFRVEGDGVWSNDPYGKTLEKTFPTFQAARARFTSIANADTPTGFIPLGSSQRIAAFRFTGERSDGAAELRVTDLTFQLGASPDISLTNAVLRGGDADGGHACTVSSVTITCSGIPAAHGIVPEGGRVIALFADVASTGAVTSPSLHITLNNPGVVDTVGHISWTDGTIIFTWVPFEQPVVRGTRFR